MWQIAMVCLLPLLAAGSPRSFMGVSLPWGKKARTWLVLFGAAFAGHFVAPGNIWGFALIDGIAAALVLQRPRGETQRAIGLLFVAMLFTHVGFYMGGRLQPGPYDLEGYAHFNRLLGWLQWAFLATWGVRNAVVRFIGGYRDTGDKVVAGSGV